MQMRVIATDAMHCPAALVAQLALNHLVIDDETIRDGNCGVHAFVIGILDQSFRIATVAKRPPVGRLRRIPAQPVNRRVEAAREEAVNWLSRNRRSKLWGDLDVSAFCLAVSGHLSFDDDLKHMALNATWVDTGFLLGAACAFEVDVCIFQMGGDPVLLGLSTLLSAEAPTAAGEAGMVPIALVNDFHFWGVVELDVDEQPVVDKGDPLRPDAWDGGRARKKRKLGESNDASAGENPLPTFGENLAMVAYAAPCSNGPGATRPSEAERATERVNMELALGSALARWDPWADVSEEILMAMEAVSHYQAPANSEPVCIIMARARACQALAYEETHAATMPEALKYQRAARLHLLSPRVAARQALSTRSAAARSYMELNATISLEAIANALGRGCSRHKVPHACLEPFTADAVRNWRALWWSLPRCQRKERLLASCREQHAIHIKAGGKNGDFQMTYYFLGIHVCRDAFMLLTGLGASSLQDARQATIDGKVSFASRAELGWGMAIVNTSKAKAYLGARQWLEWYAAAYAEWSPMKLEAHLPGARRKAYYSHYYIDALKKRALDPDHPVATYVVFCEAWRVERPWLIILTSVCSFTKCGVCEYLRLVEQTPRDQGKLREALLARLGAHFQFQGAQRLAQGLLEEEADQSQGRKWFMKIDKMDQNKTVTPTIWSQLSTPFFKDLEKRLITGMIGSKWNGTLNTHHHMRSVFADCTHGSEMQCSAILVNFWAVAMEEGHLPEEFTIGADNTPKETKNQYCLWFQVWLLCVCDGTCFWVSLNSYLLVGHTHDGLDRFFSRFMAAITGHDWFEVDDIFAIAAQSLRCRLKSGHLAQTWNWKALLHQPATHAVHGMARVHAIKLFRANGVFIQWKQYMTDNAWSEPVLLVPQENIAEFARFRPAPNVMEFSGGGQANLDWIAKLEHWCASMPGGKYTGLEAKFDWLRRAVAHKAPEAYAPGASVDNMIRDLLSLPASRPQQLAGAAGAVAFPHDALAQQFPGCDLPAMPTETLIQIEGVTHMRGARIKSNVIVPGSTLIVRTLPGMSIGGIPLPFLAAVAVQTARRAVSDDKVLVVWYLPGYSSSQHFRTKLSFDFLSFPCCFP